MTEISEGISADRYCIERELGVGGMAVSRQPAADGDYTGSLGGRSPMSNPSDRLTAALADRYTVERELGTGGMAFSRLRLRRLVRQTESNV